MNTAPIIVEQTYNAPVNAIWEAITDKEQMKEWYFDVDAFKPEVGFEFSFMGENEGRKFKHLCKITEVIPGSKLAHTWRYEGYTGSSTVTFELAEEDGKT